MNDIKCNGCGCNIDDNNDIYVAISKKWFCLVCEEKYVRSCLECGGNIDIKNEEYFNSKGGFLCVECNKD